MTLSLPYVPTDPGPSPTLSWQEDVYGRDWQQSKVYLFRSHTGTSDRLDENSGTLGILENPSMGPSSVRTNIAAGFGSTQLQYQRLKFKDGAFGQLWHTAGP